MDQSRFRHWPAISSSENESCHAEYCKLISLTAGQCSKWDVPDRLKKKIKSHEIAHRWGVLKMRLTLKSSYLSNLLTTGQSRKCDVSQSFYFLKLLTAGLVLKMGLAQQWFSYFPKLLTAVQDWKWKVPNKFVKLFKTAHRLAVLKMRLARYIYIFYLMKLLTDLWAVWKMNRSDE